MNRIIEKTREWKEQGLLLPLWFQDQTLRLVDQLALPRQEVILEIRTVQDLASAIETMKLRGSGAIGIAGAYGLLLEAVSSGGKRELIEQAGGLLKATRPTAVNLTKTVDEILEEMKEWEDDTICERMEEKVCGILERQLLFERRLGEHGASVLEEGDAVLTHCNSGALAGSGYGGRAMSVIRSAWEQGKRLHVYVSETRPYLQGARITAYELGKLQIPYTIITDGMSGYLMRLGRIQKVVVGSDRIAANGDLINKVGTYMHALAASASQVPFYTATSSHTIDLSLRQGMDMEVEYRSGEEVLLWNGVRIAPDGASALYPSFDVTPHKLISGIITEKGVKNAPYTDTLRL